jgi:hypothetical protein
VSSQNEGLVGFPFKLHLKAGLLVCAGGFEDRSVSFATKVQANRFSIECPVILRYESQREDNEPNFIRLRNQLKKVSGRDPLVVPVHGDTPILSSSKLKKALLAVSSELTERTAFIDISGMTHLWALSTIHACLACGLQTQVVYTEAKNYFPSRGMYKKVVRAWTRHDYETAVQYLQSAGLKTVHISPEFSGNFRPGRQTCLIVFVGYEPNRIESLVDYYAPGVLIVLYGSSPHQKFLWRTELSKELHRELFSKWHVRESEISTLNIHEILKKLEIEYQMVQDQFDVALAPQCSKMQALGSFLFWRKHPDVQLLFTSPVTFNPKLYSRGAGETFLYEIR